MIKYYVLIDGHDVSDVLGSMQGDISLKGVVSDL